MVAEAKEVKEAPQMIIKKKTKKIKKEEIRESPRNSTRSPMTFNKPIAKKSSTAMSNDPYQNQTASSQAKIHVPMQQVHVGLNFVNQDLIEQTAQQKINRQQTSKLKSNALENDS